jgi:hypothetical protein
MTAITPDQQAQIDGKKIAIAAARIMKERATIGMPIRQIDAVSIASAAALSPNGTASARRPDQQAMVDGHELAIEARRIMKDRHDIGMPVRLVDAVDMAGERKSAAPARAPEGVWNLHPAAIAPLRHNHDPESAAKELAIAAARIMEERQEAGMPVGIVEAVRLATEEDPAAFASRTAGDDAEVAAPGAFLLEVGDGVTFRATAGDADMVRIMPSGTFKARDGRGPFTTGDRTQMQRIVDASIAYAGGTELMVDYDHQSVFGAVPGVGGRAPAAGWIKELQARDDGIYGRVAWTAAATDAIKAGSYRYLSPYFMTNKQTGDVKRILNVALLNRPAFDLPAVAASARNLPADEAVAAALAGKLLPEHLRWANLSARADLRGFEAFVATAPVLARR